MTRKIVTITLKKPFPDGAGGLVNTIDIQEPSGADFFLYGSPQTWVKSAGGMALIDNDQAIRAYAERCIIKPNPLLAMTHMGVHDAIAVKDAIAGFFQEETPTE